MNFKKNYLNILCAIFIVIFVLGFLFLWRDKIFGNNNDLEVGEGYTFEEIQNLKEESVKDVDENTDEKEIENTSTVKKEEIEKETNNEEKKSVENDLPNKINLAVPFTSQAPEKNWDQPWQDACEEAAVLMLDAYYRNYGLSPLFAKDELQKMVDWETEKGWGGSIEIEKVKQVVDDFVEVGGKKEFVIKENPTVQDIKESIANGHPVLVVADGKVLPNPHFSNGGPVYHALIIRGYTDEYFITNDPGTQFGENFKYKYQELLDSIRDWNNGDVKTGKRVILLAEN